MGATGLKAKGSVGAGFAIGQPSALRAAGAVGEKQPLPAKTLKAASRIAHSDGLSRASG